MATSRVVGRGSALEGTRPTADLTPAAPWLDRGIALLATPPLASLDRAKGSGHMRVESSVTAVSWIPSEAISGMPKLPFEVGIGHYDEPSPEALAPGDLDALRDADRY